MELVTGFLSRGCHKSESLRTVPVYDPTLEGYSDFEKILWRLLRFRNKIKAKKKKENVLEKNQ